jgi:membrane associated rhomboid family serine protease
MTSFIALLVIALVAWRVSSKDQRIKVLRSIDVALTAAWEHGREDLERFNAARRARLRWPLATSALAALSVVVFLWAPKTQGGPTDLPWGASFGPLTSNGEWWRLVTAVFVNRGFFQLLVSVAALVQIGLTLERLVGPMAFASVFLLAGLFSGLAGLSAYPMGVTAGPAGAIWGLYGMLLVVGVPLWRRRSDLMLPLAAIERLGAVAVIFALANIFDRGAGGASQLVGLAVGIFLGLATGRGVANGVTPTSRAAAAAGVALAIALLCATPLRGILDVRPEIDHIVNVEHKTAANYQAANEQYRKGRMTADTLAELIDRTIVPELQMAAARLDTLHGIPAEDMPRMADAREFLRLRSESWRLRAQGLRLTSKSVRGATKSDADSDMAFRQRAQEQYQSTLMALGKADGAERASFDALSRLQQPPPTPDH